MVSRQLESWRERAGSAVPLDSAHFAHFPALKCWAVAALRLRRVQCCDIQHWSQRANTNRGCGGCSVGRTGVGAIFRG